MNMHGEVFLINLIVNVNMHGEIFLKKSKCEFFLKNNLNVSFFLHKSECEYEYVWSVANHNNANYAIQ